MMTEEDEQHWKTVTDTVTPLGAPGAKRKRSRAVRVSEPRELDLHGLKVHAAYEVALEFIERTRYRKILIITGRSGQIRQEFPLWLENHPRVKSLASLNEGAFEVTLGK